MKLILLFLFAFSFVCSKQYYFNQLRNYTQQISSNVTSAILFPKSITTSKGNIVDFAIGSQTGYLYLGNLVDYDLKQYRFVSDDRIRKLQWMNGFLHILTENRIRVVDLSRNSSDWIKFQSTFTNAYLFISFGFSSSRNSYLTAYLSRQDYPQYSLVVEQNSTIIYKEKNINLTASGFNITGDYFYFYSSPSNNSQNVSLSILSIATRTVTKFGSYLKQYPADFVFVPIPGYQHLFFSSNTSSRNFNLYKSQSPLKIGSGFSYSNIKFTGDGSNLIGIVDIKRQSLGIVEVDDKSPNLVKPQSYQTLLFNRTIGEFYTYNDFILVTGEKFYNYYYSYFTPIFYICSINKNLKEIESQYAKGFQPNNDQEVLKKDLNEEFGKSKQFRFE